MIHAVELDWADPLAAFAPFARDDFALLLDSAAHGGLRGRYSYICAQPRAVLRLRDDKLAFQKIAAALGPKRRDLRADLPPFQGGLAGLLSYDLGRIVEKLPEAPADDVGLPDICLGVFPAVLAFDHEAMRAWALGEADAAEALAARMGRAAPADLDWQAKAHPAPDLPQAEYRRRIARVVEYIHAGDIFQANLAQRFCAELPESLDPFTLYRRLRQISPAPFAAYLKAPDFAVASASPERFLQLSPGGAIETRPIKGTRPRGADPAEDRAFAQDLADSAKDRAENLMIVDLLRNDLSRVCIPGSVTVPALHKLETFASVHHLVSVVEGRLRADKGPVDLLRAAFPGGSITGAPKVRAMEIISEMEQFRRGAYCGSMVWLGWDGAMDSSILIRTLTMQGRRAIAWAGGGIVADSDPQAEYDETITKIRPLLRALEGLQ